MNLYGIRNRSTIESAPTTFANSINKEKSDKIDNIRIGSDFPLFNDSIISPIYYLLIYLFT